MTLPTSPPISMSQVATELGVALPLSFSNAEVLALAGKTALPNDMLAMLGGAKLVMVAGTAGPPDVGYKTADYGSLTPDTYRGTLINHILTGPALFSVFMNAIVAQNYFERVITPIGTYTSVTATYFAGGGTTHWTWPKLGDFVNSVSYNIFFNM